MRVLIPSWQRLSGSGVGPKSGPLDPVHGWNRSWVLVTPKVLHYFAHCLRHKPWCQRNPELTATGSGSWMRRSFFLYHTYMTSISCSRLRVAGPSWVTNISWLRWLSVSRWRRRLPGMATLPWPYIAGSIQRWPASGAQYHTLYGVADTLQSAEW